ncbi:MAG: carbohydrate kinase, partial [Armatimonadetes bacterium]|nr:carbohydrate kinase [Armatimonadota bacterium]
DGEGYELLKGLRQIGATTRPGLIASKARFTPCYTKPMLRENGVERELERIDIKNREPLPEAIQSNLLRRLSSALDRVHGVVIAD